MRRKFSIFALLMAVFPACAPTPDQRTSLPEPGTMRVVFVEPVTGDGPSMLPNGAFDEWYAGLPEPTGFHAPAEDGVSSLLRDAMSAHLGTRGYTARQTWSGVELLEPPLARFGTMVMLEPSTRYKLDVVASATPGMRAAIGAYELGSGDAVRVLARAVVEVDAEAPARYTGTFETRNGGRIVLASHAIAGSTLPGSVTWSAWALTTARETLPPVSIADVPARRVMVHAALDQVRRQMALYGGADGWSEGLQPVRKNLARIHREAQETEGESVLGYNEFVFAEKEIAALVETGNVAHGANGGDENLLRALVTAERSLNARGIHFLVLPVPTRMRVSVDNLYKNAAEGPVALLPHALLLERLLESDVWAKDTADAIRGLRGAGDTAFWRADPGIPSRTIRAVAQTAAGAVAALGIGVAEERRTQFAVETASEPLPQGLLEGLMERQRAMVSPEEDRVYRVRDAAEALFQPAPNSPVLAAGSYANHDRGRGGSFAAHLSHGLGHPVALLSRDMSDAAALAYLADPAAPELRTTRLVVFCFPEGRTAEGGEK